jgi:hypothetical protein
MTPRSAGRSWPAPASPLLAASLLTSAEGAEVQIISRDGHRLRLAVDEETARTVVASLWGAPDPRRRRRPAAPRRAG